MRNVFETRGLVEYEGFRLQSNVYPVGFTVLYLSERK